MTIDKIGKLAKDFGGRSLTLAVLESGGGFYIGTTTPEGPFTRESREYWPTNTEAQNALDTGQWTQRPEP